MNSNKLIKKINTVWDEEIIPTLIKYIEIPNKSPAFDPNWKKNGHMDAVLDLAVNWTEKNKPSGSKLIIKESLERTPTTIRYTGD